MGDTDVDRAGGGGVGDLAEATVICLPCWRRANGFEADPGEPKLGEPQTCSECGRPTTYGLTR